MSALDALRRLRRAALCIPLACVAPVLHAGNFSVSPVRVQLSPRAPVAALTLNNAGDVPLTVQATGVAWTQQGGEDQYAPTDELIVSPPLFTVPPHASQIIRVGLRGAMPTDGERACRLFLREIPPPPAPGSVGVQMALQMNLPVFAQPAVAAAPKLNWSARADGHKIVLHMANDGNAHVQLTALRVTLGPSQVVYDQPLSLYLLPGSGHNLAISVPGEVVKLIQSLSVHAKTDAGPDINTTIAVPAQ